MRLHQLANEGFPPFWVKSFHITTHQSFFHYRRTRCCRFAPKYDLVQTCPIMLTVSSIERILYHGRE